MCCAANKAEVTQQGTQTVLGCQAGSGTVPNADPAEDAERRPDKQLSKRPGTRGLMRLWDVQKGKQSRNLDEILPPYSESMCTVYCSKMILKFYSTLRKETGKTFRLEKKLSVQDLKKA